MATSALQSAPAQAAPDSDSEHERNSTDTFGAHAASTLSTLKAYVDTKFEQSQKQADVKFAAVETTLSVLQKDVGELKTKVSGLEVRMGGLEARMGGLEARMGGLEVNVTSIRATLEELVTAVQKPRTPTPPLSAIVFEHTINSEPSLVSSSPPGADMLNVPHAIPVAADNADALSSTSTRKLDALVSASEKVIHTLSTAVKNVRSRSRGRGPSGGPSV